MRLNIEVDVQFPANCLVWTRFAMFPVSLLTFPGDAVKNHA